MVSDWEGAHSMVRALSREFPNVRKWKDLGPLWKSGPESFTPYLEGSDRPWGFLPNGTEDELRRDADQEIKGGELETSGSGETPTSFSDPHAGDLVNDLDRSRELLVTGKTIVTSHDFAELFHPNGGSELTPRRLGMAMASLGVRHHRVLRLGVKVREYDTSSSSHESLTSPRGLSTMPEYSPTGTRLATRNSPGTHTARPV